MPKRNQDNREDWVTSQRRFKRALYAFALVEFLVTAFAVYYKVRH